MYKALERSFMHKCPSNRNATAKLRLVFLFQTNNKQSNTSLTNFVVHFVESYEKFCIFAKKKRWISKSI